MRGPFLSLSEFYNRRLEASEGESASGDNLALAGAVESALMTLAEGGASENPFADLQAQFADAASEVDMQGNTLDYPFPAAAEGNPAYGFPGWTRQADVLRSVSGLLSPRDDTFIIRAYGASKDSSGNTVAEAWCEAVVKRSPEFVSGDDKYLLPTDGSQPFGRKYVVMHFRWLSADEV